MTNELTIIDAQNLSAQEREELDKQVVNIIERHKNNRYEINRLVFEGTQALSAGEKFAQNVGKQGKLKRFWKRFSGGNARTQDDINTDLLKAQYAAQMTLQKLAEQNLMTFEVIAAVNNKLNASVLEVKSRINTLLKFFKHSRAQIIDLEMRLKQVEKNVNLLNWQNSIEYRMYDGVEYQELDDVTKIVCLARDFFNITEGNWRTSDLLLLKTAMATMGLNPKSTISCENFIRQIRARPKLFRHLVGENYALASEAEPIIFGVNKMNRLAAEENYLVQSTGNLLATNGINLPSEEIIYRMADAFVAQEADFQLSVEINSYEFILELLCNLAQLKYAKESLQPERKAKTLRELFIDCQMEDALPLALKAAEAGDVQARYMLAVMWSKDLYNNKEHVKKMIAQNIAAGDICSIFRGYYFDLIESNERKNYLDKLTALADGGDVFAQYELGNYYERKPTMKERSRSLMAKYYKMAADQGYVFAQKELAFYRYYLGWGGDEDYRKAVEILLKVHAKGHCQEANIASCYSYLGEHDEQLKWLLIGNARDEHRFASELGNFYRCGSR